MLETHLRGSDGLAPRVWNGLQRISERSREDTITILVDQHQRLAVSAPIFQHVPKASYSSQTPGLPGQANHRTSAVRLPREGPP